jgi:hypothetical protein
MCLAVKKTSNSRSFYWPPWKDPIKILIKAIIRLMNKTIIILNKIFSNSRLCNARRKETKLLIRMRQSLSRISMKRKESKTSSSYASRMGSRTLWTLRTKTRVRTRLVNKVFKIICRRSISKWELRLRDRIKTEIKWTRSLPIRTFKRTLEASTKARTTALTTPVIS